MGQGPSTGAIACLLSICLAACHAERYSAKPYTRLDNLTEYLIEDTPTGFVAYVYYSRYQFIRASAPIIEDGLAAMRRIVAQVAQQGERELKPLNELAIESNMGRGFWDSCTSWSAKVQCYWRSAP